jgi:hypothetical protein
MLLLLRLLLAASLGILMVDQNLEASQNLDRLTPAR